MPFLQKMSQNELIIWIRSLQTDNSFSNGVKQQIISGIQQYAEEEEMEVTGQDFFDAEDANDIKELTKVTKAKANLLWKKICLKKQEDYETREKQKGIQPGAASTGNNYNSVVTFTLNVLAKQGQIVPLEGINKNWTVSQVKAKFLEEQGNQTAADNYRMGKWDSNAGKIELKKSGKSMDNHRKLEYYGIVSAMDCVMPLVVSFKVIGGAYQPSYESKADDQDKFRNRKLRTKKYKQFIKISRKPDCIMGYTDNDGIRRAEMPCGCAVAADTMYRYMKSLFEKDYKSAKLYCPTPKNQCKGNANQREWQWSLIFIIADLSQKEIAKYSRIINNRISGAKDCPFCGATTERPKDLRICRVRCKQCHNNDWCWNCRNVWKSGGNGPICGNKSCMGAQLNAILKQCGTVTPSWQDIQNKGGKVPKTRACPKCCTTLEYTSACKHMWCLCCPHEFCFNCLGDWKTKQCSHSNECSLAPVQVFH